MEVDLEDQAEFLCTVQGHPLPSVKWVKVDTGVTVSEENTMRGEDSSVTQVHRL